MFGETFEETPPAKEGNFVDHINLLSLNWMLPHKTAAKMGRSYLVATLMECGARDGELTRARGEEQDECPQSLRAMRLTCGGE